MDEQEQSESRGEVLAEALASLESQQGRRRELEFLLANPTLTSGEAAEWFAEAICARTALLLTNGAQLRARRLGVSARSLERLTQVTRAKGFCRRAYAHGLGHVQHDARGVASYRIAVNQFERAGDQLQAAITKSGALKILAATGKEDDALQWAEEAAQVFIATGDRLRLARLQTNVAGLLTIMRRWKDALEKLDEAYTILVQVGSSSDVAACLETMGLCCLALDRTAEASKFRTAARLMHRRTSPFERQARADDLLRRGLYGLALQRIREWRIEARESQNQYEEMFTFISESQVHLRAGRLDLASGAALRSLQLNSSACLTSHRSDILILLLRLSLEAGRPRQAASLLREALKCCSPESDNQLELKVLSLRLALLRGDLPARRELVIAEEDLRRAGPKTRIQGWLTLHSIAQLLFEQDWAERLATRALRDAGKAEDEVLLSLALEASALASQARGDSARAVTSLTKAVQIVRAHRMQDPECLNTGLASLERRFIERAVDCFIGEAGAASAQEALPLIEQAKSTRLCEQMKDLEADSPESASPSHDVLNICSSLSQLALQLEERISELDCARPGTKRLVMDDVARVKEASRDLRARLRFLHRVDVAEEPLTSAELLNLLPAATTLVEYFIAQGKLLALVVEAGGSRVLSLGVVSEVERAGRQLLLQLSCAKRSKDRALVAARCKWLYECLIQPLELDNSCDRLIVIPDGFLHRLPFHCFRSKRDHLIDQFCVSYAPSATVLARCQIRSQQTAGQSLVIWAPDRNNPGVEREVRHVSRRLPGTVEVLSARDKEQLIPFLRQRWDVVHFANHGFFNPAEPSLSSLLLENGSLDAGDVEKQLVRANMVVMSGCSTGATTPVGADDALGLSHALFSAGAARIVATLWDVRDQPASLLMRQFYDQLTIGQCPVESLRLAALNCRERFGDEADWGPFILSGAIADRAAPLPLGPHARENPV